VSGTERGIVLLRHDQRSKHVQIVNVMTPNPRTVQPGDTLQAAAQLMDELNVGVLPVTDGTSLIGMLTDRDIVVRSTSAGQDPRTATVADAMSSDVRTLPPDASVLDAIRMMQDQQLRRVPVVDTSGTLVGILSLGDLADAGTPEAADALEAISTPAEPDR
jgi:CBS domain-containing protein